jgi:hypothetical protein
MDACIGWLVQSGGPNYQVELGRYDGRVSTRDSVVLPHANFNLDQLNAFFAGLGLSQTDMIALSGTPKMSNQLNSSSSSWTKNFTR